MKTIVFDDLQTVWPVVTEASTRLLSSTVRRLSFLHRLKSASSSLSSSLPSALEGKNSTMQQCWPTYKSDIQFETSTDENNLKPCEFCYEPSSPVVITDIYNSMRERQSSEPVSIPNLPTTQLINCQKQPHQQSHSSDYESTFGNELSPTTNYWTLGVNDLSSCPSLSSDEFFNDHDRSVYDESSRTEGPPDEQKFDDDIDDDSFEVISFYAPPESTLYIKEFQHTTSNSQNNVCGCCNASFTSKSNLPARRCHYYGKLYCPRCHTMDEAHIPAKIIKSFDMRLYPVCRRAKSILQLNFHQPIFDIQNDNENLYVSYPILSEIKSIRLQFQHFYAYLSTCPRIENELHEKFFKDFYARDYLYQSVHLYSVNDLLSLKKILHILNVASIQAKRHIRHCVICREKGFICEICKNRKDVLYPFDDTKRIGECSQCSNIYHRKCWENIDHDCPKCYRLIQRNKNKT